MTTILWMMGGLGAFVVFILVYIRYATWMHDDDCQHCKGLRDGIPGEEIHINGLILCKRCYADYALTLAEKAIEEAKKAIEEDGNNSE